MLGTFALAAGGVWMWRRDRKRAVLLLVAAAVTLLNVLSWSTLPAPDRVAAQAADRVAAQAAGGVAARAAG
jgi:hypothetical protein